MRTRLRQFILGPERGALAKLESSHWWGLRIAVIGGLTALLGALGTGAGSEVLAPALVGVGVGLGALGMLAHFAFVVLRLIRHRAVGRDSTDA